jgi:hypothetical protein
LLEKLKGLHMVASRGVRRPQHPGELLDRMLLTALITAVPTGMIASIPGVLRNLNLLRGVRPKREKDRDVDIDVPSLPPKQAAMPYWQSVPPWLLSAGAGGLGGMYLADAIQDRLTNIILDRQLSSAQQKFKEALLKQMLAAEASGGKDPFAPYYEQKSAGEKQARGDRSFLATLADAGLLTPYALWSATSLPFAWYWSHRLSGLESPAALKYTKAKQEAAKMLATDKPRAQLRQAPLDRKTRRALAAWAKKHGLVTE